MNAFNSSEDGKFGNSNQETSAGNTGHSGIMEYVADKDVFFAKERYKLHEATPGEGVSLDILKNYILKKYGI